MFCPNCRNEVDKGQLFCRACGEKTKVESYRWLLKCNLFFGSGIIGFVAMFMLISRLDDFFRALPPIYYYSFFALFAALITGAFSVLSYELHRLRKQTKKERKKLLEGSNYNRQINQNYSTGFANSIIDQTTRELVANSKIPSGNLR